jgi:uncharacterized protein (DUF983 family)
MAALHPLTAALLAFVIVGLMFVAPFIAFEMPVPWMMWLALAAATVGAAALSHHQRRWERA